MQDIIKSFIAQIAVSGLLNGSKGAILPNKTSVQTVAVPKTKLIEKEQKIVLKRFTNNPNLMITGHTTIKERKGE